MKHLLYQLCTLGLILAFSTQVFSQTAAQRQVARKKGTTALPYGYYEYLPSNYSSASKLPVVIFFHGIKEAGNGTSEISRVLSQGPPKMVSRFSKDFPFILISPQHPSGWWSPTTVDILIDYIVATYKVDPARVYVTGLSAGANGTWVAGQSAADKVAAIVPICGCGSPSQAANMKNMGVWAFHNDKDQVIGSSCSVNMVKAINAAGGRAKLTLYSGYSHDAWTKTYNDQTMWDWLLSQRRGTAPTPIPTVNKAPIVSAGADKILTLPTNSTTLTATASDSDGTISSYTWTKVSGPTVTLANASTKTLSLSTLLGGTYTFKVTVKDNTGATAYDQVNVTVNAASSSGSLTVNAGIDKIITLPTSTTSLTATPNSTVNYTLWTKVSGPSATMTSANQRTMSLSNLVAGIYVFKITVKNTSGATATDVVNVTVKTSVTTTNIVPTVYAGADKTITLPTNTVTFSPTYSDRDGDVVSGTWVKVSGPAATLTNPGLPNLKVINMVAGTYVFRVTVKDDDGATNSDDIQVIVKSATSARIASAEEETSISTREISLYPNPAAGRFNLNVNFEEDTDVKILIVNSKDGRIVYNQELSVSANTTPEINIASLSSGVYFVKVMFAGQEKTLRLIKL